MKECLFSKRYDFNSRIALDAELPLSDMYKDELYLTLFNETPQPVARKILAQAQAQPEPITPDYIWFGRLEKEFAGKSFPEPDRWKEVFRNSSVIIYGRMQSPLGTSSPKGA
jgi:hypothetical protein